MSRTTATTRLHSASTCAVLGLAALLLGGCQSSGQHVKQGIKEGQLRLAAVKSGVELQMAQQQFLAGDLEKARRTTEGVLTINPEYGKAFLLYGRVLVEQGDLEGARTAFLEAQRLSPEMADAHYYLGIVFERFSQPANAMTEYQAAMAIEPGNAQYVVAAGEMLVQGGQFDEAETLLLSQKDSLAHSAAIRQTLGRLAMVRNQPAKAARYFDETRLLAPDDQAVLEDLVRAQVAAKQWADAEFNASVLMRTKANADRRDLLAIRAHSLTMLGRFGEARALLVKLTEGEEGSRDLSSWVTLGKVAANLRDWGRVRLAAGRIVALAPDHADGYALSGMALREAGENIAALRRFDQAIERAPQDADLQVYKALTLQDLGRADAARICVQRALEIQPDNTRAASLLQVLTQTASVPTETP